MFSLISCRSGIFRRRELRSIKNQTMPKTFEWKIGQQNCQKKGNLRRLRAKNSRSFPVFFWYDVVIIATRARVSISVNPSPIWCSVRLLLDPQDLTSLVYTLPIWHKKRREPRVWNLASASSAFPKRKYTMLQYTSGITWVSCFLRKHIQTNCPSSS